MRKAFVPFTFCIAILAGYLVSVDSWDGAVFVYLGERRAPAAVRSMGDYTAFNRKALFASAHRQMLEGAKLIKQSGYVGLTLGHPLMKSAGRNDFACPLQGRPGLFDRVELTFVGTGISESGEQPKMIVEADCGTGGNVSELETIWIPMQDILSAPAKDQEMQMYGDHPVVVRLEQIPGEWPVGWVLTGIRLFRQANPDENFSVGPDRIREINGKLLGFDWTDGRD